LAELRRTRQGALPGQSLVVFDPVLGLATDIVPCEDGHAQERSLIDDVLAQIRERDLWIADRNFCTTKFLFGIAARKGCFLIRQHGSTLTWELVGQRRHVGASEHGTIYEQTAQLYQDGEILVVRRITIELEEPTRDGERAIHLLTNLPAADADAVAIAAWYRGRWTIEGVFQELTQTLQCEVNTLGYPRAALFGFSVALVAYNTLAVAKAALRAEHGAAKVEEVSDYQLAMEVSAVYEGMAIAVPEDHWSGFQQLSPRRLGQVLRQLARGVRLQTIRKHRRGPKKPRPQRKSGAKDHHVATARLLAARTKAKRSP